MRRGARAAAGRRQRLAGVRQRAAEQARTANARRAILLGREPSTAIWRDDQVADPLARLDQGAFAIEATWSTDGAALYVSRIDGVINVWRGDDLHRDQSIQAHETYVSSVELSADGEFLISAGGDGSVRTWSAQDLRLLHAYFAAGDTAYAKPALGGTAVATLGYDSVDLWRSGSFTGSAAELQGILRCRIPMTLRAGRLVPTPPSSPCTPSAPDRGDPPPP